MCILRYLDNSEPFETETDLMGKESLLFYIPELEEDDCRISCNAMITRAKDEDIYITSFEGEKLAFSK